jgi:MarR family transcriptional repressor of emrRAB
VLNGLMERLTAEDRREFTRLLETILPLLTPDRETSDHICRLCQLAACPQDRCPVELAVPSAGGI